MYPNVKIQRFGKKPFFNLGTQAYVPQTATVLSEHDTVSVSINNDSSVTVYIRSNQNETWVKPVEWD